MKSSGFVFKSCILLLTGWHENEGRRVCVLGGGDGSPAKYSPPASQPSWLLLHKLFSLSGVSSHLIWKNGFSAPTCCYGSLGRAAAELLPQLPLCKHVWHGAEHAWFEDEASVSGWCVFYLGKHLCRGQSGSL